MKKILLFVLIFITTTLNTSAFQLIDSKKTIDFVNVNDVNTRSYLITSFKDVCKEKCNVSINTKKNAENKFTVFLKGNSEDVKSIYTKLNNNKKLITSITHTSNINNHAFLSLLEKEELESNIGWKQSILIILFIIVVIGLIQTMFNKSKKDSIPLFILLGVILMFLITIYFSYISPIKEQIENLAKEKIIYGTFSNNNSYTISQYVNKEDIDSYSEKELENRTNLDYYYTDMILGDTYGNPIKSLSNSNKIVIKEQVSNFYYKLFNIKTSSISVYSTKYGILVRIHKHPYKENLVKMGSIAVNIGMIYARHKITSKIIGPRAKYNDMGHTFNNLITMGLVSNMFLYLQSDMTEIHLPN